VKLLLCSKEGKNHTEHLLLITNHLLPTHKLFTTAVEPIS